MNKTILQTHIDLLKECKRQNQMLEKLIELNMNDLHEIADQRDWYYEECQKMKAGNEELIKVIKQKWYKEERDEYKIGHDRYEKLRRLNLQEMKELYLKNLRTGEHFDILVDKLCQVK
jgi:hypothetical protein